MNDLRLRVLFPQLEKKAAYSSGLTADVVGIFFVRLKKQNIRNRNRPVRIALIPQYDMHGRDADSQFIRHGLRYVRSALCGQNYFSISPLPVRHEMTNKLLPIKIHFSIIPPKRKVFCLVIFIVFYIYEINFVIVRHFQ